MKNLTIQFKQFLLSTVFVLFTLTGFVVKSSFNNDYVMQIESQSSEDKIKKIALVDSPKKMIKRTNAKLNIIK